MKKIILILFSFLTVVVLPVYAGKYCDEWKKSFPNLNQEDCEYIDKNTESCEAACGKLERNVATNKFECVRISSKSELDKCLSKTKNTEPTKKVADLDNTKKSEEVDQTNKTSESTFGNKVTSTVKSIFTSDKKELATATESASAEDKQVLETFNQELENAKAKFEKTVGQI